MGNRAFADFPNDPGDPRRTADRRRERRDPHCRADPQPAGKDDRRSHESSHLSAMWRFGVFPGAGVVPYIVAQLLGSVLGVVVARAVWGPVVAEPRVAYAVLQPGPGWSSMTLFVAETLSMAVIVLLVGVCLAEPRLAPFVPWIVGGVIGLAIATLGTSTGGSVNPARQFGPAALSGQTRFLWVYLLAPMVGAMLATWVRETVQRHRSCTHTQTMRHSPRRQLVVKLKDGCVAILQRDGRLYKASGVLQQRLSR